MPIDKDMEFNMMQFSYTTDKPKQFFIATFVNNDIQENQTVNRIRRKISNQKSKKYNSSDKQQYHNENYSILTSNDYSYVPFVPAFDFFNNKVSEDGSYGTHLYRDCFGRFYDNCSFNNMD